jgi:hypothetical protein
MGCAAMKFMIEFQLKADRKRAAVELFERIGPNRNPGVAFRGAWIGSRSDLAFVLVESAEESLVAKVAEAWREEGACSIHPVIDIEQF